MQLLWGWEKSTYFRYIRPALPWLSSCPGSEERMEQGGLCTYSCHTLNSFSLVDSGPSLPLSSRKPSLITTCIVCLCSASPHHSPVQVIPGCGSGSTCYRFPRLWSFPRRGSLESPLVLPPVSVPPQPMSLGHVCGEGEGRMLLESSTQTSEKCCWEVACNMGSPRGSVVKNPPALHEMWVRSLGWEDPLEKEMATHSSVLAWETLWREEPGGLYFMGLQKSWIWLSV